MDCIVVFADTCTVSPLQTAPENIEVTLYITWKLNYNQKLLLHYNVFWLPLLRTILQTRLQAS